MAVYMSTLDADARVIWDYMLMHHELKPADAIFILGSTDLRVGDRAAELYHQGLAPFVICSGGNGKVSIFDKPEAQMHAEVLEKNGVPRDKIILEERASNTGENILFTKALVAERGLQFHSFILVQKPYMERRTYATFRKQWPEAECIVTSPRISYDEYASTEELKHKFISLMTGDLQRIKEYPVLGYQIPQDIPADVWGAYERLVAAGFTKYAISVT